MSFTGLPTSALLEMVMPRVKRGLAAFRRNPVVTQLDALNDLCERYYAGDRKRHLVDRIAALFYLFLEKPVAGTKFAGIEQDDVRQECIAKLWDWLLSGHLKAFLPIRKKGFFGLMVRNQAIDMQRKLRMDKMEGMPREPASTGFSPTEEQIERAQKAGAEYSGREAAGEGPTTVYLKRWYGRRPDVVLAMELGVTTDNLRVRAHRAGVSVTEPNGFRKVPELLRDANRDLAVPVIMPRKPPAARKEWFLRWYPVLTETELIALTGYSSWARVRAAARRLGLEDRPPETAPLNRVGMEWVSLVYPYLSDREMAVDLGIPVEMLQRALRYLDVNPAAGTRKGVTRDKPDEAAQV